MIMTATTTVSTDKQFRDAFSKVSRVLEPLSHDQKTRILRAMTILIGETSAAELSKEDRS
jgi:hypothetical protein